MLFPWQRYEWQRIWRLKEMHRLPHALLFLGQRGIGKTIFAEHLTKKILCKGKSGEETCVCHDCQLVQSKVHPNVRWIEPESENHAIKIDQIREITDFINQSNVQGEYKIVLIHCAHQMNSYAANALLKTLEEPSLGSLIILIANQRNQLPMTIQSRCQYFIFQKPEQEVALQWLKNQDKTKEMTNLPLLLSLAEEAPLTVLQWIENGLFSVRKELFQSLYQLSQRESDPILAASKIKQEMLLFTLDLMLAWIVDLLRLQFSVDAEIKNQDYREILMTLKKRLSLQKSLQWMEYLQQLRGQITKGINLNKQLVIENLFIRWMEDVHVSC